MKTPISYPFVRDATFISGVGPSIAALFLNTSQDGLADLYGALLGRSATLELDDFSEISGPMGKLGSLDVNANVNGAGTMRIGSVAPVAAGEHGIWQVIANLAASFNFSAVGHTSHIGPFDFVCSSRVVITSHASLDTVANRGFQIGIFSFGAPVLFVAGNNLANWQLIVAATVVDTGVPVVAGRFTDLQLARLSGNVTAYIDGALVGTVAHNVVMNSCQRVVGVKSPGANVGEGFGIDYLKAWYQR